MEMILYATKVSYQAILNPILRTIEITKLLENMQEMLKKETEYVIIHKFLLILIYIIHN